MKAIIMAGGEGSRLRPLTCGIPKPMAPVMNRPVMEHSILLLKKHGIRDIGVTLRVHPEQIRDYFGDGTAFGVRLTYFLEETPLGTAGSVKNAADFCKEDFLVISGDAMTDVDLGDFISFHKAKSAEASLLLKHMDIPLEYGVVVTDERGRIVRFLEKPGWSQVFSDTVNTGIYLLKPSVLSLAERMPCDFSKDIFPRLLEKGRPLYGYVADGYWCDIGDLDAYRHCHYDIFAGKTKTVRAASEIRPGIYAEEGAVIEAGAELHAPLLIGTRVHMESGARIDGYTAIGEGCHIRSGASIKRSVLLPGVTVSKNAQIRGSVLCAHSFVGEGAALFEQSVLGEESKVGAEAVVRPGVKIWPYKAVGNGEILSESLVWGNALTDSLFQETGMEGDYGTQLLPQTALRLGRAVGTLFEGRCGISADGDAASLVLKKALSSGLMASGSTVFDFGNQPLPITRSGVRVYGLSGAVHASVRENRATITVMGNGGAFLSRDMMRKLMGIYHREDFKSAEAGSVLLPEDGSEYKLYYLRQLLGGMQKTNGIRVAAAAGSPAGRRLLAAAAAELGWHLCLEEETLVETDTAAMRRFAEQVPEKGCRLGAVLSPSCETVHLVDERGRRVEPEVYEALSALMVMRKYPGAHIIAGAGTTSAIEALAKRYGAGVRRTKASPIDRLEALSGGTPAEEAQRILQFDGVGALARIVDFLEGENTTLSALLSEIPPFYIRQSAVPCTPGDRGRIIRLLSRMVPEADTLDGVKIREKNGWVLILPDGNMPACRIIAEGSREEYARELTDLYDGKIREILQKTETK